MKKLGDLSALKFTDLHILFHSFLGVTVQTLLWVGSTHPALTPPQPLSIYGVQMLRPNVR